MAAEALAATVSTYRRGCPVPLPVGGASPGKSPSQSGVRVTAVSDAPWFRGGRAASQRRHVVSVLRPVRSRFLTDFRIIAIPS